MTRQPHRRQAASPEPSRARDTLDARIRRLHGERPFEVSRALQKKLNELLASPEGQARIEQMRRELGEDGTTGEAPRTSARRAAGRIADLPARPKELVAVGDWVRVEPRDGDPIGGFVDRVARDHVWVRPHPSLKVHGIDWRERKTWKRFLRREKGSRREEVYRHNLRAASGGRTAAKRPKSRTAALTAAENVFWDRGEADLIQPGTPIEDYRD